MARMAITSTLNYGLPSSVGFGMKLNLSNISDTLNLGTIAIGEWMDKVKSGDPTA